MSKCFVPFTANKKGDLTFSSVVVILFVGALILFVVFITSFFVKNTNSNYSENSLPTLTQDFPQVFLTTFLNLRVSETDKKQLQSSEILSYFSSSEIKDLRVKDIIVFEDEISTAIVMKLRKSYLEKYISPKSDSEKAVKTIFDYYNSVARDSIVIDSGSEGNYLEIRYSSSEHLSKFDYEILERENFFVVLKTPKLDKFVQVCFMGCYEVLDSTGENS